MTTFNPAAVVLLAASLLTWIGVEFADHRDHGKYQDNIKSEDVDKLNSLLKIIDRNEFYTIKEKSMQTYMEADDYDGLRRLKFHADKNIFPFHNIRLQRLYEEFSEISKRFLMRYYSLYTYDGRDRCTWRQSDERYVDDDTYQRIQAEIHQLDLMASNLAERWQKLVGMARIELKDASRTIERYDM